MTMHGRRFRRTTALLMGTALASGALLAAPIGQASPAAAADGLTITPNPAYEGPAVRGLGHEPRLVRQRDRGLPRGGAPGALRQGLRRGRPEPQHRPLQHRRRQRDRRPGLPAPGRRRRGLVEPPPPWSADASRPDHRLRGPERRARRVGCRRPRLVRLRRRRDPALVGRALAATADHALGGVQQLRRPTS